VRENRRIKTTHTLVRLTTVKTLTGFDFAFQPSLDRQRILSLAELIAPRWSISWDRPAPARRIWPPRSPSRRSRPAEASTPRPWPTCASLGQAEGDGQLRERIRYLRRPQLLVVDETGYLPSTPGGGNLFFQLVNARYEKVP
jgi:DNA replication protein DnaC